MGAEGAPAALLRLGAAEHTLLQACYRWQDGLPGSAFYRLAGGLYALHLSAFLRAGFVGRQFLLVPTAALGAKAALQEGLASFFELPLSAAGRATAACGATPKNSNKATDTLQLPGSNESLAQLLAAFDASDVGRQAQAFYRAHDALLPAFVTRHGVQVVGALTSN